MAVSRRIGWYTMKYKVEEEIIWVYGNEGESADMSIFCVLESEFYDQLHDDMYRTLTDQLPPIRNKTEDIMVTINGFESY